MRLSDAILAGSTCLTAMPYAVLWRSDNETHGCAMGMALYAMGFRDERELKSRGGSKSMPPEWKWLKDKAENPHLCECRDESDERLEAHNYLGYITHLFNEHVYPKNMTLESLVDYVRSIEPAEEAERPEPTADDPYPDDEPLWSDTQTRIEQMNSIKGR